MIDKELKQWLKDLESKKANLGDHVRLDELLAEQEAGPVPQIVRALGEDAVNLQWRSSLNERLLSLGPIKKRISLWLIGFGGLAGVGLASLFFVLFYGSFGGHNTAKAAPADPAVLASAMVSMHQSSVASSEIAGQGISGTEQDPGGDSDESESL